MSALVRADDVHEVGDGERRYLLHRSPDLRQTSAGRLRSGPAQSLNDGSADLTILHGEHAVDIPVNSFDVRELADRLIAIAAEWGRGNGYHGTAH
jgi:hypothetical protein